MKTSTKIILGLALILIIIIIIIVTTVKMAKPKEQIVLLGASTNDSIVYQKELDNTGKAAPLPIPNPPTPNGVEEITLNSDTIIIQKGARLIMKIGVYNPSDFIADSITPVIKCRENTIIDNVSETKDIGSKMPEYYVYSMTINPLINTGPHYCDILLNGRLDYISKSILLQVN